MNNSEKIDALREIFEHEIQVHKKLKDFYKKHGQSAIAPHELMDEWLECQVMSGDFETLLDVLIEDDKGELSDG